MIEAVTSWPPSEPGRNDPQPAFLTVREVATTLRISPAHAYRLVADGQIPHVTWGARKLVPARWVDELVQHVLDDWEMPDGPPSRP